MAPWIGYDIQSANMRTFFARFQTSAFTFVESLIGWSCAPGATIERIE
jgi:hypothetical protein